MNSNAYYFVDVVAERGPAPIRFMDANGAMPDDPVVVARAGEVCRIPLVIGVEYAVTSAVPFTVSVPSGTIGRTPDYTLTIGPREGGGTTVHWPIRFSYVEEEGSTTDFTVDVSPDMLELEYNWRVTRSDIPMQIPMMMGMPLPGLLGSPVGCGCFEYEGSNIVVRCYSGCDCQGCTLGGTASHVGHSIHLPSFTCGCSEPREPSDENNPPDPSTPSMDVSFSAPAVIYEDAYVNAPGETVAKRSTLVTASVSVSGGPSGGIYSIDISILGRLVPISGQTPIPIFGTLGAYETLNASCIYEGAAPSGGKEDVKISGFFVDPVTGDRVNCNGSNLTVFKVELQPKQQAPNNPSVNRHMYGVNELVACLQTPSIPVLEWDIIDGGSWHMDENRQYYRCPLQARQITLYASYGAIAYEPQLAILAPTGIVSRNPSVRKYINVPDGHAGGLGLVQEFHVIPDTVSFSQISVEEHPCENSSVTGYFAKASVLRTLPSWSHTTNAGAGVWFRVDENNRVGGNEPIPMTDESGCADEWERMMPDGTLTTNTAYGWLHGTMIWDNPFAWTGLNPPEGTSPTGVFATSQRDAKDIFTITTSGSFSSSKLSNTAMRLLDGRCFLNGTQTVAEEVDKNEFE